MKTKVVVVIPNWNGEDFIAKCLKSLETQSLVHHIIVVDNGSVDNSVHIITEQFPKVELLKFNNNAGFAGGVNRGIRKALEDNYEFIALFNNDAIADKNWLKSLVMAADDHPESGIITGKFMKINKKYFDSTGDMYSIYGMPFPRGRNQPDKRQYDKLEYVFGATGGASLYRTKMLKEVGLFDENFFAYYEDVDMSFRAQLYGWKVLYQPLAVSYHHISGTSAKLGSFARFHSIKNFIFLYTKNMPNVLYFKYLPLFLLQFARMLVGSILDREFSVFVKSVSLAIRTLPKATKERRVIQSQRSVNIKYIDGLLYHRRPPKIPGI